MPLKKLWNSLRGRSQVNPVTTEHTLAQDAVKSESGAARRSQSASSPLKSKPKSTRGGLNLFGGPHAALCKQLKSLKPATVLEIGVGNGTRAIAMLATIEKAGEKARYFAIDQFEMAGGDVTLKAFHQTLRGADIRPQVLPQPIAQGLMRMAHTHGKVDLVVIGVPQSEWQTPAIEAALARVTGPETAIFFSEGDSWIRYQLPGWDSVGQAA